MVEYRGYVIEEEVREDLAYECPLTGRYYLVPSEPRTYFHVYGKGMPWMALLPSIETAKLAVDAAISLGSTNHLEFYPGRG